MSRKAVRRLLFVVALLTVPIPFYLGEPELAPVLRLAFITSLMGRVLLAEGGGTLATLVGLGAAQILVWGGLLFVASALLAWRIDRLRVAPVRIAIVSAIAIGLLGVSLAPIYDTPLSSKRMRSNVLQLFE